MHAALSACARLFRHYQPRGKKGAEPRVGGNLSKRTNIPVSERKYESMAGRERPDVVCELRKQEGDGGKILDQFPRNSLRVEAAKEVLGELFSV